MFVNIGNVILEGLKIKDWITHSKYKSVTTSANQFSGGSKGAQGTPPRVQILSISCNFRKFGKIVCWHPPPLWSLRPLLEKSWIRDCSFRLPGVWSFCRNLDIFQVNSQKLRRHRMWSLNRQLQCKSVKIYWAQTTQNLALTKILHNFRKMSTLLPQPTNWKRSVWRQGRGTSVSVSSLDQISLIEPQSYPEFVDANFKCALWWTFKQQLALKCKRIVECLLFSWDVLVLLNLCKILAIARFCGVCAR